MDASVHAAVRIRGGHYDVGHRFPALCGQAGLRLVSQRGFVPAVTPRALLETFQGVLRSLHAFIVDHHVSTDAEVDDLLGQLDDAKGGVYISAFANLYIEMIAEVPHG